MNKISNCRSCKKQIGWTKTRKNKDMPVDYDSLTPNDRDLLDQGVEIPFRFGEHMSHFATCPNSKEHRKVRDEIQN